MDRTLILALLNNASLLLVLSVIYEVAYFIPQKRKRLRPFFSGLMIAVICVAIMSVPFTLQPGIIYDTRSILISITGLVFGPVPTLFAVVAASIVRLIKGGAGTIPGLVVIYSSALIGLAWRRYIFPRVKKLRWLSVYLMSVLVHAVMIACMLLLPYPDSIAIIRRIALPVIVIYPVASLLLHLLLMRQTEIRRAQNQLKQSEERFQLLFEKAPLGYQSLNNEGHIIAVNQKWLDMFGYTRDEVLGRWFGDFLSPVSKEKFLRNFSIFKESGHTYVEHTMPQKNGNLMIVSIEGTVAYSFEGEFTQTHCILQDITERKQAQEALILSEEKYRRITDNISDVVWTTDLELRTTFISPSVERLLGDTMEIHLKRSLEERFPPASLAKIRAILADELLNDNRRHKDRARELELEHYRADGTLIWLGMNITILRDTLGTPAGFLGVSRDITALKKAQADLQYLIDHDDLTGVYNRRSYEKQIERLDVPDQLPLSIIVADINGLKLINDSFGHEEGDKIILKTSEIIRSCCREGDYLARTGGDEFCILLPGTDLNAANATIQMIQSACDQYNAGILNEAYHISLAFGAETKIAPEEDFVQIHKHAEDYLNQSKLLKKNSSNSAVIASIRATMLEKSLETEAHSVRLAILAKQVGEKLNLSQVELNHIELLATLHDIGKVGISERILKKPGKLDPGEWNEMKKHPEIGYRIAMSSPNLAPIANYILHHHERWDGTGYPQNLRGSEIPLLSRVIAVVDAYDAMTENRVYREAMTHQAAIDEIRKCAGTQFDPEIAQIFISILEGYPVPNQQ